MEWIFLGIHAMYIATHFYVKWSTTNRCKILFKPRTKYIFVLRKNLILGIIMRHNVSVLYPSIQREMIIWRNIANWIFPLWVSHMKEYFLKHINFCMKIIRLLPSPIFQIISYYSDILIGEIYNLFLIFENFTKCNHCSI